jgi:prepilin-type N-terminal cleavage/methylation domain-containing protein
MSNTRVLNCQPRPPHGFTLVELLVVIAIIGILVALLLPAVQAAREAARRAQCTNHLKQIGLAIHNFHDARKGFPRSRMACHHGTWATELWPYLEENSLADQWDKVKAFHFQPAATRQTNVSTYFCPSRRSPPQVSVTGQDDRPGVTGISGALADYAVCSGDSSAYFDTIYDYVNRDANGAFICAGDNLFATEFCSGSLPDSLFKSEPLYVRFKSLIDGTGKTLLVGEKQVPQRGFGYWFLPGEYVFDNSIYNPDYVETLGRFAGPNLGLARSVDEAVAGNFGGPHSGICQFVFADGSVHAIAVEIDEVILGYLANRRDGQTISDTDIY